MAKSHGDIGFITPTGFIATNLLTGSLHETFYSCFRKMAVFLKNRKENDLPSFGFEDEGVYRLDDTASLFIKSIRELMGDKFWSKEALEENRCQEARDS